MPSALSTYVRKVVSFFQMNRKAVGIAAGALVIALIVGWVVVPAPSAQGSQRGHTVEIHRNGQISVIFNQPMNKGSVQGAFQILPAIDGAFSWDGSTLLFRPAQDFEKGLTYEVTIGEGAKSLLGKKLADAYRQSFFILDYPEVSVVVPVDGTVIEQDQRLTVLFDHPVRVLSRETVAPALVQFSPAVPGEFLWLGTSGFEFVPSQGWPAARVITATIPAGTKTVDGGETVADYVWHLQTEHLTATFEQSGEKHDPRQPVRIVFNYPVAAEAVASALVVHKGAEIISADKLNVTVDAGAPKVVKVAMKGGYELSTLYEFNLPEGFTGGVGELGFTQAFIALSRTGDKGFSLASSTDGGTLKCVYCSYTLYFNNPVDDESLRRHVSVSPAVTGFEANTYAEREVYITGQWKPSTEYKITLGAALADIYGQTLNTAQTVTFKTGPYDPRADLASYSRYGVFAKHLPRVYQLRTLNLTQPFTVDLCAGTMESYVQKKSFDCSRTAQKSYETNGPLNGFKVVDIDLDDLAGADLPVGAYTLDIKIPELNRQYYTSNEIRTLLIVDTALTLKRGNDGKALVWATDLQTGQPVAGLELTLWNNFTPDWYSGGANTLDTRTTDANGLATFEGVGSEFAAQAQGNGRLGFAASNWEDGISPWNYNLEMSYSSQERHIGYVYTDRRIYRPDQMVEFKGIIRYDKDAELTLPTIPETTVRIIDSQGNEVYSQVLRFSDYGTFHGSLQLQPTMPLGTYTIEATGEVRGSFDVREYRRPDFEVTIDTPAQQAVAGRQIEIPVTARYYHGVPLGGAVAEYSITRRHLYFQPASLEHEWYLYSEDTEMYGCWWYCDFESEAESVASGEVRLDDDGRAVIRLSADMTDYDFSANYAINVTVRDSTGRTVSGNEELAVHKGDFYFGIRADYADGWESLNADFNIVSVSKDGEILPDVSGVVTLYRRDWSNVQKENTDGTTYREWTPVDTFVSRVDVRTGADGRASVRFQPSEGGEYVAKIVGRDRNGNTISAAANRYMYFGAPFGGRVTDDHHMMIEQNRASYNVGDTATLAVQTPYASTKALVTVERDTIREYRVIDLGTSDNLVDIDITDDATPNIYVSVLAVQGGGDNKVPEFRLGYASLQVNTTKKILDLTVTPDRDSYKPGETVTLNVASNNADGRGVPAEVSIAVVDERVVALLGSIDKNILGKFWFPRLIGVRTSQTLTRLVKKVFFSTEGGGGKGGDGDGSAIRGNFKDTAYWNANLRTDASGRGTISFTLPDNLTRWQILAIGTTKDTVVGSTEAKIITRRDLMVEPLLPRIVRHGDQLLVGANVFNTTERAMQATVRLTAEGVTIADGATKSASLQPGGRSAVYWRVNVPSDGAKAKFTALAQASGLQDGFTLDVPILPFSVPETVTASGILERNVTETLRIPDDVLRGQGGLTVAVQPNIGNGLQSSIDYLVTFPYGCAEQLTSSMLGNLMYQVLEDLRVTRANEELSASAKRHVDTTIQTLLTMQNWDGGFGFWQGSQSYTHLTAYVFWGLAQAQKAGFDVSAEAMDKADRYLRNALSNSGELSDQYFWDVEKAQAIYALSERDPSGLSGYANALYERRAKLPVFSRAFLAMAYANIDRNASSSRAAQLMKDLKNRIVYLNPSTAYIPEDSGYEWYMSTDLRSTSLYLQALLRLDSKNEDVERLLRYIVETRADGYWHTTQNTAMALNGLVAYVRANPVSESAMFVETFLNNQPLQTLEFAQGDVSGQQSAKVSMPDLLKAGLDQQVGLEKASDTRYFYDISLKTYRAIEDIEPFENGFTLVAETYALSDEDSRQPLDSARVGDIVRVRLKLLVPKNHRYVAMEHHLPAGLEAIDFTLNTSPQQYGDEVEHCAPSWNGEQFCISSDSWQWGWWWENVWKHIETRDDRVFLFAETLEPGVYEYEFLAQAVTAGTYRVPPARVYEFYNPLANAHNEGKIFTVNER